MPDEIVDYRQLQNKAPLYKGFSTYEFDRIKRTRMTDIDIVKMDILNHLYTRKGERLMMPGFGSDVPEMLFEPLDEMLVADMQREISRVVNYDPRVELIDIQVYPIEAQQSITAIVNLRYIELDIQDTLELNLELKGS